MVTSWCGDSQSGFENPGWRQGQWLGEKIGLDPLARLIKIAAVRRRNCGTAYHVGGHAHFSLVLDSVRAYDNS